MQPQNQSAFARRPLPPPSLQRRKRPSDDESSPDQQPVGGWVEETDPNAKYLFRYESAKREGDSDEGVSVEPSGRRVERKDRKNKREQERRKEINDRFALLSDLLFGSKFSGRVDKTQILDRAIDLVRNGPSVLRAPEGDSESPAQRDRETWQQGDMNKGHIHGRYHENCSPHCHAEMPMDSRDMGHAKFSPYQHYSNFPHNGHPMGYTSTPGYSPSFFSPYSTHPNYPPMLVSEPPHFSLGRNRSRCLDCEGDGNTSPDRRFRCVNGGTCRKNAVGSTNNWGNHGVAISRKDPSIEDSPEDGNDLAGLATVSQAQTPSTNDETNNCNNNKQRRFAINTPPGSPTQSRVKVGFEFREKGDTGLGMQVALLDTLVQLSQNPKRIKK